VPIELQSRTQDRGPGGRPARDDADAAIGALARGERAAVVLERVSRSYPRARHRRRGRRRGASAREPASVAVLSGLSLRVRSGELVALVGPSGCGKSTLLELICGLQRADEGTLAAEPAVLMAQRDLLLPWLSALDNAALALRVTGHPRSHARSRALALFAELGLDGFERARPHELSGGMRQRVAFARTLLSGKPVLCLDEPFGALDAITRAQMQRWLAEALSRACAPAPGAAEGDPAHGPRPTGSSRTVVLVTHDVEEAALLADRVIVLSPRPARVTAEIDLHGARPRHRDDPQVRDACERALAALGLDEPRCEAPAQRTADVDADVWGGQP
jgi:ABC-type nitrate/sulfonate/bicarbonate transport system ATPase subunit